ncbi:MAG TPA: hypothetical protein VLK33_23080 [Terriglobales bacterium]|nr:hypothetical protein [Terriglobales bacterium]
MAKTYVDGSVTVVRHAQKYLTRWQSKMVQSANPDQIAALTDLIACIALFLAKWHKSTPVN